MVEIAFHCIVLLQSDDMLEKPQQKLAHLGQLLESYSFQRVLDRGFTVIRGTDGRLITRAQGAVEGTSVTIEFAGDEKVGATLGKRLKP